MYDETIFAKCRKCNCQFAKSAKTSIKNFTAKFPDRPRFSLGHEQASTDDQNSSRSARQTQTDYLEWVTKKKIQPPN